MVDYELIRKKNLKRINLRVKTGGKVVVTAPTRTPKIVINNFVASNKLWILKQQESKKALTLSDGQKLGELTVRHSDSLATQYQYERLGQELYIDTTDTEKAKAVVVGFVTSKAREYLPAQVEQLADVESLEVNRVVIKNNASRWGSCSNKSNINLSAAVWLLPSELQRYVLSHELAHLVHLNHSKDFWGYVSQMHSNYKVSRKKLSEYGYILAFLKS